MSMMCSIPLVKVALWSEGDLPDPPKGGWPSWLDRAAGTPDVAFVEPMTRRRLSRLARSAFHCAARVAPPGGCRTVFASQHGDLDRTAALLADLASGAELSPTHFAMSVHNATLGQWSLLQKDHSPACAVAAGLETFACGLLEAWSCWRRQPELPVLYVFAEDRVPEVFQEVLPVPPPPHAAALLLGRPAALDLGLSCTPTEGTAGSPIPFSWEALRVLEGRAPASPWLGPTGAWSLHGV